MATQQELTQETPRQKNFFKILLSLVVILVLGGSFYFFFLKKPRIPEGTSSHQALADIVEKFADAQKVVEKKTIVYSFKGNLVRMSLGQNLVTYEYDLGKGILLAPPEKISLPANVLPFEYFGKKVTKQQELNLGDQELNLLSELKIWCRESKDETKPCHLTKWSIVSVTPPEKREAIDYLNVVEKALAWLENQKNEKGIYYASYRCFVDGKCEEPSLTHTAGLAAIWARFKHYEVTQDGQDLATIKGDLSVYADESLVNAIQNDFWNCQLMYQLWQSNLFSQEDKAKIENICWRGDYNPVDLMEIDTQIQQGEINEVNLLKAVALKPSIPGFPTEWSKTKKQFTEHSTYAADFLARYLWKKEENDFLRAKAYFGRAVDLWTKEPVKNYLGAKCTLGIAAMDLYKVTSNADYLDFATSFFEKEKIGEHCLVKKGEMVRNYCTNSIMELSTCGLFAQELFEATNVQEYHHFVDQVKKYAVNNFFDFPDYGGYFLGDGAFNSIVQWKEMKDASVPKSTRGNSLMIGLLLK